MRSYLSLIPIVAKKRRKQSIMTILCIVFSVILVTGVFTMADFGGQDMFSQMAIEHGNWHISLKNISEEKAAKIGQSAIADETSWYGAINEDLEKEIYVDGKKCLIEVSEESIDSIMPGKLLEGKMPEKIKEAAVSDNLCKREGYRIGDEIVVLIQNEEVKYKICGITSAVSGLLESDAYGILIGLEDYDVLAKENNLETDFVYYVRFKDEKRIQKNIAKLKEEYGFNDSQISENTAILGTLGMSSNNYMVGLYVVASMLTVLVILAGVFMIAASMNTNVDEKQKFYGMVRCIGASKRQVKIMVCLEALWWCITAIPLGAAIATLLANIVSLGLRFGIGGEWSSFPFGVSVVGVSLGVIIGIITVLLAAFLPAERAAKVSPIVAVSGNISNLYGVKRKAGKMNLPIDFSLGINHAFSKKKNIILMTGSFALSIILFLMFSVMIEWIDNALNTNELYTSDISILHEGYMNDFSHELLGEIQEIDGVKNAYGRMHVLANVTCDKEVNQVDIISYDELQFKWSEKDLIAGDIEETLNGNGVMTVFDKDNPLEIGDVLHYGDASLTIVSALSDSPFSSDGTPVIICTEEVFTKLTGIDQYAVIDIQMERKASKDIDAEIRNLLDDQTRLSDRRMTNEEANNTFIAFCILVYGFLGIVALIAVFNIVNSISMSTEARHYQNCIMHSIGMEYKQINRMILTESLSYAISGCVAGCIVGIPLQAKAFELIISNYYGITWQFPIVSLAIIMAIVLGAAFFAAQRVRFKAPAPEIN